MSRILALLLASAFLLSVGCSEDGDAGRQSLRKSKAAWRSTRRAYDGAPPVIPHPPFQGGENGCTTCHNELGMEVADVGFAPPSPHERTAGLSAFSRCTQCHVSEATAELFVANSFTGLPQDLRRGERAYEGAPPVMPHPVFMRENCKACHTGQAAREEIRTSHPERENCAQCHVPRTTRETFVRSAAATGDRTDDALR